METVIVLLALVILLVLLRRASGYEYTIGKGTIHTPIGSAFLTTSNICQTSCQSNANCDFWQWSNVNQSCQLFSTSAVDKTTTETGFKTSAGQPDYKYGAVPDMQGCMDACTKDPKCIGWVHYNKNATDELQGTCSLIAAKADGYKDFQGFKI